MSRKTSSFSPEGQFPEGDLTSSTCLHRTTRRNLGLGILLTTVETYWVFISSFVLTVSNDQKKRPFLEKEGSENILML